MKSLLQSAMTWFNGTKTVEATAEAEMVVQAQVKVEPEMKIECPVVRSLETSETPINQIAPAQPADLVEFAEIKAAVVTAAPELKLTTRGSKLYGTCPSCEATFNIRERLMRSKYRKVESSIVDLSCPACDKPVALPARIDLRKLS